MQSDALLFIAFMTSDQAYLQVLTGYIAIDRVHLALWRSRSTVYVEAGTAVSVEELSRGYSLRVRHHISPS